MTRIFTCREASEAFGVFIGELACMSDEYLDVRPPEGGRTVREIVEHVLDTLEGYVPEQFEQAVSAHEDNEGE
jgi:hypothetical protein